VLKHPMFVKGEFSTNFLEKHMKNELEA